MKSWSVGLVAVVVLSLASWLLIYQVEGRPPTQGITIALVGLWIVVVGALRAIARRRGGPPA